MDSDNYNVPDDMKVATVRLLIHTRKNPEMN